LSFASSETYSTVFLPGGLPVTSSSPSQCGTWALSLSSLLDLICLIGLQGF
jgi:hypothetical protein